MTFQEAQARFSAIASSITPALTPAGLRTAQEQLRALQDALPIGEEFDPINDAIVAISPKLTGMILESVVHDLASRTANLESATAMLEKTARQAAGDARTWSFEQPRLLAAGLTNGLTALQELRDAVKKKDLDAASAKADALLTLLVQLRSGLKAS